MSNRQLNENISRLLVRFGIETDEQTLLSRVVTPSLSLGDYSDFMPAAVGRRGWSGWNVAPGATEKATMQLTAAADCLVDFLYATAATASGYRIALAPAASAYAGLFQPTVLNVGIGSCVSTVMVGATTTAMAVQFAASDQTKFTPGDGNCTTKIFVPRGSVLAIQNNALAAAADLEVHWTELPHRLQDDNE